MTAHRGGAGLTPVDALIALIIAVSLVVVGGAIYLRALDYELDRQSPPTTVTPTEETSQP